MMDGRCQQLHQQPATMPVINQVATNQNNETLNASSHPHHTTLNHWPSTARADHGTALSLLLLLMHHNPTNTSCWLSQAINLLSLSSNWHVNLPHGLLLCHFIALNESFLIMKYIVSNFMLDGGNTIVLLVIQTILLCKYNNQHLNGRAL